VTGALRPEVGTGDLEMQTCDCKRAICDCKDALFECKCDKFGCLQRGDEERSVKADDLIGG
jgi:hypothetical protein